MIIVQVVILRVDFGRNARLEMQATYRLLLEPGQGGCLNSRLLRCFFNFIWKESNLFMYNYSGINTVLDFRAHFMSLQRVNLEK